MIDAQIKINDIDCELYGVKIEIMKRSDTKTCLEDIGRFFFANEYNDDLRELREVQLPEYAQITADFVSTLVKVYGIYVDTRNEDRKYKGKSEEFVPKTWGTSHLDTYEIQTHTITVRKDRHQ